MARVIKDFHTCDLCGEVVETEHKKRPAGWAVYNLPNPNGSKVTEEQRDICEGCKEDIALFVQSIKENNS